MRFGEFKRASQEHLDEILVRLCAMVVSGQK